MGQRAETCDELRKESVTKIHGQLTDHDITTLKKNLVAIAASILSGLGGGNQCFTFTVEIFFGMLLSNSSIFSNALICASPFTFFLPFRACVKSSIALMIMSACIKVGCVMYRCLINTVSDILSLLVFLR
jgi:hypothetical protein